jgi:hypothetical protein
MLFNQLLDLSCELAFKATVWVFIQLGQSAVDGCEVMSVVNFLFLDCGGCNKLPELFIKVF